MLVFFLLWTLWCWLIDNIWENIFQDAWETFSTKWYLKKREKMPHGVDSIQTWGRRRGKWRKWKRIAYFWQIQVGIHKRLEQLLARLDSPQKVFHCFLELSKKNQDEEIGGWSAMNTVKLPIEEEEDNHEGGLAGENMDEELRIIVWQIGCYFSFRTCGCLFFFQ